MKRTLNRITYHRNRVYLGWPRDLPRPHPLTDKIVVEGGLVAGSQVSNIRLPQSNGAGHDVHWFNSAGQIVFIADDQTGTGLYVADNGITPPPQNPTPTSRFEWIGPGNPPAGTPPNGSFGDAPSWRPLDGTTDRVPGKTSTNADIAIFDRAEAYTVDLGTQHAEQLIVKNGNVSFTQGSIGLAAVSFDQPSVVIDNARLALAWDPNVGVANILTCNHALIGQSGAARVDVDSAAEWLANGSLRVGGPGEGILTIDSAGNVTSAEARIGGAGGGRVNVGENGKWTTGNLAIGIGGQGDMVIQDGGMVESDLAIIGEEPGLGNKVTVQGNTDAGASKWEATILISSAWAASSATLSPLSVCRILHPAFNSVLSLTVRCCV